MKLGTFVIIFAAMFVAPAHAQVASLPTTFKLSILPEPVSFKELDEADLRWRITERLTFQLNENITVGRISIQPVQSYVGSYTWKRRLLGVSVHWRF